MPFRFTLASVLRVKQSLEKQEELALQSILVKMAQVQHQVDTLNGDIVRARQLLDEAMQQMLPAVHVDSMTNQIRGAIDRKRELLVSLAELHRQRDVQNRKYHSAHNSRKMLSDMQTRQYEAYAQERARTEQKLIDDAFARRVRRT